MNPQDIKSQIAQKMGQGIQGMQNFGQGMGQASAQAMQNIAGGIGKGIGAVRNAVSPQKAQAQGPKYWQGGNMPGDIPDAFSQGRGSAGIMPMTTASTSPTGGPANAKPNGYQLNTAWFFPQDVPNPDGSNIDPRNYQGMRVPRESELGQFTPEQQAWLKANNAYFKGQ